MKHITLVIFSSIALTYSAEVRLVDLEPSDAQQLIDQQDTSLKYAPKIDSNVPAVRFLGNEPHHVREDIYLANQYHGQDGLGGYLYGYGVPDIAKTERKIAGGDLKGAYNYITGDGKEIRVQYWDDGTGFHQTDNAAEVAQADNPQVAAAKEEFQRIWQQEAERNSKPIASPYDSEGKYLQGVGPQPVPQGGPYGPRPQYPAEWQRQGQTQYQQPQPQYQGGQLQGKALSLQGQQPVPQLPSQPHAGQNVQYFRDSQYQGQQTQTVNQYQPQPQPQAQPQSQPQAQTQVQSQPPVQSQSKPQVPPKPLVLPQLQEQPQPQGQQPQVRPQGRALPLQAPNLQSGQYTSHQGDGEDSGEYDPKKYETEEPTGPPKGFFYNFDYPVGIIVKEEGLVKRESNVQDLYDSNKELFEKQLRGEARPPRSSSNGYLYVKN